MATRKKLHQYGKPLEYLDYKPKGDKSRHYISPTFPRELTLRQFQTLARGESYEAFRERRRILEEKEPKKYKKRGEPRVPKKRLKGYKKRFEDMSQAYLKKINKQRQRRGFGTISELPDDFYDMYDIVKHPEGYSSQDYYDVWKYLDMVDEMDDYKQGETP
jgi:hypothetical protein